MNTHADKTQENKGKSDLRHKAQKKESAENTFEFENNRPDASAISDLHSVANNSHQINQTAQLHSIANNSQTAIQKQEIEEEELLQGKFVPIQKKENKTGLPDKLKAGVENISGYSLDDVKVHYNSSKPLQFRAHAYAQGTDIHLASGQEKHLPHEAWHVVQQKQGRVQPTAQFKAFQINDNQGLEKEADVLGAKAVSTVSNYSIKELSAKDRKLNVGKIETLQRQVNATIQMEGEEDNENVSSTRTLLDVAQQLVSDLEGHKRGWLIDIKPKKIYTELKKVDEKLTELTKEQGKLTKLIEFGKTLSAYDNSIRTMSIWKAYIYGSSTGQYKAAKGKKKEIEKSLGVKGFRDKTKKKKVRKVLKEASENEELTAQLEETNALIIKLQLLTQEIKDRAIARGAQLEEVAKSKGETAVFPCEGTLEQQMNWLELWLGAYPEVITKAKEDMASNEEILSVARAVQKKESTYEFEAGVYQKLLTDYNALTKPGTSMSQSIKFTFTAGEVLEGGFFVKVAGEIATGDDRKIRPKLAFTVGATIKIDLGLWDASGSLSLTYAMVQGYDGLHHFTAHYMKLLSLYEFSFKNYMALQTQVSSLRKNDPEYDTKRIEMIKEAKKRGFIAEGQTIEMGTDEQAELAEMQARPPVSIKAAKVAVDAGIAPNDNASGALAHFGGVTFSASYTRKWFTRLVDYSKFVKANGEVDEEVVRLKSIRTDYLKLLNELDQKRSLIRMAVIGGVPPSLKEEEQELVRLKNLYEEGNLTFFRKGRKKFKQEISEKIDELEKQQGVAKASEEIEGVTLEDERSVEKNKKKKLTKTGSVVEVEIGGSAKIGGLGVNLGGKFSAIANDANPDNDGKYLNLSLTAGSQIEGGGLDVNSEAGQKALESIAESGNFQDATLAPTSSAVTFQLIGNLAGSIQAVGGVLSGGAKLELNLVWSKGWWRTQYVRVTKSRDLTLGIKAKSGSGANIGVQYQGGKTDFIGELIGSNTFTYVLTVYQGMRKHKDWRSEWKSWKNSHKNQLWKIAQQVGLAMTVSRKEVLELPDGLNYANRVHQIVKPLFAMQKMEKNYQGGPLAFDQENFVKCMVPLELVMEKEFEKRGSLNVADLSDANWSSAEGAVNSAIIIDVQLGSQAQTVSKIKVASKSVVTSKVKGAQESVEDFSRFGTLQGLLEAGSILHLNVKTGGDPAKIDIVVPSGGDYNANINKASKSLVKALKGKNKKKLNTYHLMKDTFILKSLLRDEKDDNRLEKSANFDIEKALDLPVPAK